MNTNNNISRRDVLRYGLTGAAGLWFASGLRGLRAAPSSTAKAKAKSVIQIWLWGGATHIDTFDPKPESGSDYTGPLKGAVETNVSGIRIGELLPTLAKQADKYTLIRSMTHGNSGHETAAYMVQTGRPAGEKVVYPSVGAVVSLYKGKDAGYKGLIPPYIVLTEPQGRFSEAGFLGSRFKPFATGGDPSQSRFTVEGIVQPGITDKRQHARRDLLNGLNTFGKTMADDTQLTALAAAEHEAYDLILGEGSKVFDLSTEKTDRRDAYGRTTFGQSCLMARRLVEKGVPYVTINYRGWDTHRQHFETMRRKLPELDKGLASLISDLADYGLLDSTIIWCCGEFGRTPKVMWEAPWNGGRGHYGKVFSCLVAGGGFKGGHVIGASSARGEEVKERPVYPTDLIGSMYELLGIDTAGALPHPQGFDCPIVAAKSEESPSGGRLKEIMA
jgi:uncharacterized protein (DUF1501 family)